MGAACRLWVVGHSQDVGTPAMAMSFRIMCPGDREAELGKLRHEKQQVLGRWGVRHPGESGDMCDPHLCSVCVGTSVTLSLPCVCGDSGDTRVPPGMLCVVGGYWGQGQSWGYGTHSMSCRPPVVRVPLPPPPSPLALGSSGSRVSASASPSSLPACRGVTCGHGIWCPLLPGSPRTCLLLPLSPGSGGSRLGELVFSSSVAAVRPPILGTWVSK